jgi:phosphatidylserine/phosphatidylglycerophosphate/cardiolipin synthase-like enzyme
LFAFPNRLVRLLSFNRVNWVQCILLLLGLVLFLGLTTWRQSLAPAPVALTLPTALPQDPLIQAYFNHAQSAFYTEPYRQQQRIGDDLETMVVEAIAAARSSIQVAVHELNLPHVAQALADRQKAGVAIQVIVENAYRRPMSSFTPQEVAAMIPRDRQKYQEFVQLADQNQDGKLEAVEVDQSDAMVIFKNAGIPVIDDTADGSKGSSLMHHKFLVIDRQIVIVGSANLTLSDVHGDFLSPSSQGNANHLLKITSPALAKHFATEFNLMWGDGVDGRPNSKFGLEKPYRSPTTFSLTKSSTITVQFSPTSARLPWQKSVNGLIGRALSHAVHTVNLALFVFSDQNISNILEAKRDRNVQLKVLIEPQFAYREYSEGLDLMGVALPSDRCRYEPENHPWRKAIATVGVPLLPEGDLLHHKIGVVDGHVVITGSQNWSAAANHSNDENLLVIDNPTVAAHFQQEFDRLYQGAILGIPPTLQQKIKKQRSRCH